MPVSQTAPDVNFEEFLGVLDAETRAYLQELLAGAGQGLKNNGDNLSAAFKRFSPIARYTDRDHPRTEEAPREHRTLDPQLPPADGSARQQGHSNSRR